MGRIGRGVVWGMIKGRSQDIFSWPLDIQLWEGLVPKVGIKSDPVTA